MRRVFSVFFIALFAEFCLAFTNYNFLFKPSPKLTAIQYQMNGNIDENMSYLDKLEKKDKNVNIDKLKSIQKNITKYIDDKNKKNNTKITTRYNNPISKATFDKIFLNINNVKTIYIPHDYDRAIFELSNDQKFVFYIHNKDERNLIEKIINITNNQIKVIVICDKILMTDPFGYLYCDRDV